MDAEGVERRLAAILSADLVGYSRMMAEGEAATNVILYAALSLCPAVWPGRPVSLTRAFCFHDRAKRRHPSRATMDDRTRFRSSELIRLDT